MNTTLSELLPRRFDFGILDFDILDFDIKRYRLDQTVTRFENFPTEENTCRMYVDEEGHF
jgi:hypothetical protein